MLVDRPHDDGEDSRRAPAPLADLPQPDLDVAPGLFPDDTVWSRFGAGYGWVPAVLPFLGLAWLWHTRPGRAQRNADSPVSA